MKVTQIAETLNKVTQEVVGQTDIQFESDLSNIVDAGKKVLNFFDSDGNGGWNNTNNNNWDNYMKNLIDQIGRVIFVDRTYVSQAPNILRDSWEYGSIMMKVRATMDAGKPGTDNKYAVNLGDGLPLAGDNSTWDLASIANGTGLATNDGSPSPLDPFVLTKPSVQAKFYNKKITYEVSISLCREQLKEAFRSAADMGKFFSMIENRIRMKRTLCTDALIMATVRNLIANKGLKGGAVNLLEEYNKTVSVPLTPTQFWTSLDAIKFAVKTIELYKKYLREASMLYNDGNYVTFTPESKLKTIFLSEFVKDAETYLYSDTFHDEFVKLSGYSEVGYWQGTGSTPNNVGSRSKIAGKFITKDETTLEGEMNGVVAVLFDEDACAVCCENDRVTSIYNPRAEYTNYFYKWDASYMNDIEENVVVFYVADTTVLGTLQDTIPGASTPITATDWNTNYAKAGSDYSIWDETNHRYRALTANDKTTVDNFDWDDYKGLVYTKKIEQPAS